VKKAPFSLLSVLVPAFFVFPTAILLPVPAIAGADKIITEFRDEVYLQQLNDDQLYRRYLLLLDRLRETADETSNRVFNLAEAAYYMGRAYHSFDDHDTVIAHYNDTVRGKWHSLRDYYSAREKALEMYTRSRRLAEQYLLLSPDSRGFRLRAEILGQMILLNDIGFLLKNGSQIRKYIEKALELDPWNTKARILEAGEKIYTPRLFGGNPKEGIKKLLEVETSYKCDREDRFNIYSGIGYAYAALGKRNEAHRWFLRALEVYPGNVFAEGMVKAME
jgi:tetratricopeptide (TPR) repeat protein